MIDDSADWLKHLPELRARVRRFDFSPETDRLVGPIEKRLAKERYAIPLNRRDYLQAVTFLSEYYDAKGDRKKCADSLRPTAEVLLEDSFRWVKPRSQEEKELCRQQIWCLLAWAYNRHDESELFEMAYALRKAKSGLELYLVDSTFRCFGTLYHLLHLEGLLRRDEGHLEHAQKAFARALGFAKARMEEDIAKHQDSFERVDREREYFHVCQARTMAFGFAETEFLRGNLFRAAALFTAAEPVLSQEHMGFKRWPRIIQLFQLGCIIFTTEFNAPEAIYELQKAAEALVVLKAKLTSLRVHVDYVNLCSALRVLAILRMLQVQMAAANTVVYPTKVAETPALREAMGELTATVREDLGGPIARLVKRIHIEATIRLGRSDAGKEIASLIRASKDFGLYQVELKLLEVEHLLLRQRGLEASERVAALRRRTQTGIRQEIWARLLSVSCGSLTDDLLTESNTLDLIDDGYIRAFFRASTPTISGEGYILPFQQDGSDESLNLDRNIEALKVAVIKMAWRRGNGRSREVARLCGHERAQWWSEVVERYKEESWFRDFCITEDSDESARQNPTKKRSSRRRDN